MRRARRATRRTSGNEPGVSRRIARTFAAHHHERVERAAHGAQRPVRDERRPAGLGNTPPPVRRPRPVASASRPVRRATSLAAVNTSGARRGRGNDARVGDEHDAAAHSPIVRPSPSWQAMTRSRHSCHGERRYDPGAPWTSRSHRRGAVPRDCGLAPRPRSPAALPSGDTRRARRAPRMGAHPLRRPVRVVPGPRIRAAKHLVGVADLREEYYAAGAPHESPKNASSCSRRRLPVRHAGAKTHPRKDGRGRADVVPGMSEPNAARFVGIQSKAVREDAGNGWRCRSRRRGRTRGAFCTHMFGLFRSDRRPNATKAHLLPRRPADARCDRAPGRNASTREGFAEVFLDDVFVPTRRGSVTRTRAGRSHGHHRFRARPHPAVTGPLHGHGQRLIELRAITRRRLKR